MKDYRKKPVIIQAIQFDGWNWKECTQFMSEKLLVFDDALTNHSSIEIKTLEGTMTANIGDYIIKGANGEFYPCKPDIFEKTYEEVIESCWQEYTLWQDRLIVETEQLAERTNKLQDFMRTEKFYHLTRKEKNLRYRQYHAMLDYLQVMGEICEEYNLKLEIKETAK